MNIGSLNESATQMQKPNMKNFNHGFSKTIKYTFTIFNFCLLALACNAAQPNFWIQYSASYHQVGDNTPTPEAEHPFYISGGSNIDSGKIINAKLKTPSGLEKNFANEDFKNASFHFDYVNINSLIFDFPTGNYTLTVQTDLGILKKTTKFYSPQFSKAPRIRAGNNTIWLNGYLCVVDNKKSCSISWATPDKPIDNINIRLTDDKYNEFYSQDISKNSTSFEIPLSALNSMPEEKIYGTISFNSERNGDIRTQFYLYKQIITSPFQFIITHSFTQTDNLTIEECKGDSATLYYDFGPYNVIIYGGFSGIVNGPKGTKFALTAGSPTGSAYNSGPIKNKAELDKAFPEGTYSIGNQSATLKGSAYPNSGSPIKITSVNGKTPRWSNGKLILNPKIQNVISWTPFNITPKKFETSGQIFFEVRSNTNVTSTLLYKESGIISDDKTIFNTYTIPPNTLKSNMDTLMQVKYFLASSIDLKTMSAGAYSIATYVWISAE